ncbi:MAG: hypothetical protein V2I48_05405 [Xanthomonadales bacterium]|jgi:hypothetical protein|nr:hypothetical protein [Xanthomonadales bacterium]
MKSRVLLLTWITIFASAQAWAATSYQPFVLASVNDTRLEQQVETTVDALENAGFTIAGKYMPLDNAVVIVVTNDVLKQVSAATDRGGYAAGQRISVTERDGKTEVAFINPLYIQYAYRLQADMQPVLDNLSSTLGHIEDFGAEKNMTAKKLAKYHYMIGMQRFDDPSELGSFGSFEEAVSAVENGLAVEGDPLSFVYRIDIPGKEQAVIGIGMKATGNDEEEKDIDERFQLSIVDFEGYSKVAYFPYEILVNGKDVEALHMRFRMAVHFPDLSMMGAHGFTKLMSSPGATEDALENLVKPE